jgi:hypothetical protein
MDRCIFFTAGWDEIRDACGHGVWFSKRDMHAILLLSSKHLHL